MWYWINLQRRTVESNSYARVMYILRICLIIKDLRIPFLLVLLCLIFFSLFLATLILGRDIRLGYPSAELGQSGLAAECVRLHNNIKYLGV